MAHPRVELHEAALDEAFAARLWYAERSPAAAEAFMIELDRAIERIAEGPHRWPAHRLDTRRFVMRGFPYVVIYRVETQGVLVVAVAHTRRRPGYWKSRLRPPE